ncbi:ornithine cyclodeaminase/alanine dehydrogenase-like protein (mu-crystallin family) [Paenibacillus intestini]|nr:ornithine cyclodeaminase/alanine dehydrogenase-like protein (mu-crystallin family) [Paenibacillus intestini]
MAGKQEIDSNLVSQAILYVDDQEHCIEVGEIEIPLKEGKIAESHICGEIGDLYRWRRTPEYFIQILTLTLHTKHM